MLTEPLISVIVPVYNVEKYIEQCVDSVLNQTYKNLEIILIDDGSTDRSGEVCDEYKEKDDRVVVVHKQNGGLSSARNRGLEIMSGDIVSFVDSDDWIDARMYEDMVGFMIKNDVDIVYCCANKFDHKSIISKEFGYYPDKSLVDCDEVVEKILCDEISGHVWNKLYNKTCWENLTFPKDRLYEDLSISFRPFLNTNKKIGFLNAPYYNYRINYNGISLSKNPLKCYHIYLGMREHYDYSKKNRPSVTEKCISNVVIHALQTITDHCKNNWENHQHIIDDVQNFLDDNKKSIIRCYKHLTTKDELKIRLYYLSKRWYKLASKLI